MQLTEKLNITNEDNMKLMARYPDNYFDLAIVDPPYGIGEDGAKNHSRDKAAKAKRYTAKNWDSKAPNKDYFTELKRVSLTSLAIASGRNPTSRTSSKISSSVASMTDSANASIMAFNSFL